MSSNGKVGNRVIIFSWQEDKMVSTTLEDRLEVSYKIKYALTMISNHSTFNIYSKKKLKFMFKPGFEHRCLLVISQNWGNNSNRIKTTQIINR